MASVAPYQILNKYQVIFTNRQKIKVLYNAEMKSHDFIITTCVESRRQPSRIPATHPEHAVLNSQLRNTPVDLLSLSRQS